jgi:hypothetical protein
MARRRFIRIVWFVWLGETLNKAHKVHPLARILVAGQAPGRKVHESGVPFADVRGNRLREWLGLSPEAFYDPHRVALLPMGLRFLVTGKSGDLLPRPERATAWREHWPNVVPLPHPNPVTTSGYARLPGSIGSYVHSCGLELQRSLGSASNLEKEPTVLCAPIVGGRARSTYSSRPTVSPAQTDPGVTTVANTPTIPRLR